MEAWHEFFLGELGAAAALAGMLFVAVSVNQARILELGRMADRGLEALVMLLYVIVAASLVLVPGQSPSLLGGELLAIGVLAQVALARLEIGYCRVLDSEHLPRTLQMVALNQVAMALSGVAGGWMLWTGTAAGLCLVAPGILLTFVAVGLNAWVLLIEINR
ncbi:hypothetical protein [Sphingomonas sp.]|uniref:hypothetical protein n=1 Tax=Sphingomonas sp. TaxID=28214 RepID=UPI001B163E43|nr:hypothetical protein [Sphingomonas sp.]MBO9713622.1 hypothetical protein [Sphingomonas sp.]